MNRRIVLPILAIVLAGVVVFSAGVRKVEASGTICIRADGSIDPPTAPISTLDNVTYSLTGNITSSTDGIIVERDNIIIDGDQYTVRGPGTSNGINVTGRSNVTVKNTTISNFVRGIYLDHTNRTAISGNTITNNDYGIDFSSSYNASIYGNNITATSEYGIWLGSSSNVSISGNNITANNSYGIYLASSSNNSIGGNNIANNLGGVPSGGIVLIYSSNNNSIFGNNITNSSMGMWLYSCSGNSISGNDITANNGLGIRLDSSSGNTLSGNNVTANSDYGIYLTSSSNNFISHNSFVNNKNQVSTELSANIWDDDYPSGGNYWSDYNGTDANHDGIGDTPHTIDANNTDYFPLMGMFHSYNVTYFTLPMVEHFCEVTVISNSTISGFVAPIWLEHPETVTLTFNVTGTNGSTGFCRVSFPTAMMNGTYHVSVNGTEVAYILLPCSNADTNYLYFTYVHSTEAVIITPEFPSLQAAMFFILLTLLTVIIYKKKSVKTSAR